MSKANISVDAPRLGLALGSGAARGWAHIGVLDAIDELGVRVDCLAGASFGALVGVSYAAGALEDLRELGLHLDWFGMLRFLDPVLPLSGLIDGRKLEKLIREELGEKRIEDLSLPFRAVATDLNSGDEFIFDKGDVFTAVRASISVPGLLTPLRHEGLALVDGGLVNPVPVSVLREMGATKVIAVDINHFNVAEQAGKPLLPLKRKQASARGERNRPGARLLERLNKSLDKAGLPRPDLKIPRPSLPELDLDKIPWLRRWLDARAAPGLFEVLLTSLTIMEYRIGENRLQADRPDLLILPQTGSIRSLEFNRAEEAIAAGYKAAMAGLKPLVESGDLPLREPTG